MTEFRVMEQEEEKEFTSPFPVLPRLDRLDRLLQLLEEKHSLSGSDSSKPPIVKKMEAEGDQCKTLSSALEEVLHKGTLMERLQMLEKRVLQLSIFMDEGNTSRSSSSTVPVSDKFGPSSGLSSVTKEDEEDVFDTFEGKSDPLLIQEGETSAQGGSVTRTKAQSLENSKKQKRKSYRNWRGWFRKGL